MGMRKLLSSGFVFLLLVAPSAITHASGVDAKEVFEHLKSMSGTWKGPMEGEGDEAQKEAVEEMQAVHEFQVSAAAREVPEASQYTGGDDHRSLRGSQDGRSWCRQDRCPACRASCTDPNR